MDDVPPPPRPIRGHRQYEQLNRRQRRALDGARQVVSYSRENGVSISRSITDLRRMGVRTSTRSVKNYFGNAVRIDWRGRLVATKSDPNLRVMNVLTTSGEREVYVRGSRQASIVAAHEAATRSVLRGDPEPLVQWKRAHGSLVLTGADGGAYAPETDSDVIEDRDRLGEINYEDIYPEVA